MIDYDFGDWGVGFVWSIDGSVFPRAMAWAGPAGALAAGYCFLFKWLWGSVDNYPDVGGTAFTALWGGYMFILGFLLVFRTQIAFSRFWEGASTLLSVKGSWVNAASNIIAFSTHNLERKAEVASFHHLLVRLMSLLFCASLQQIATLDDEHFEILGDEGIERAALQYLAEAPDKCEVILHWIQRLIVQNHYSGVVPIPPPILSRVFQELGNGILDIQGARKIADYPFPFPYAQTISLFLLLHWIVSPAIGAFLIPTPWAAGVVTFCTTFAVWSINYIAAELEMPFGDDANDLPIGELQQNFNASLRALMHPLTKECPNFNYNEERHANLKPTKPRITHYVTGSFGTDGGGCFFSAGHQDMPAMGSVTTADYDLKASELQGESETQGDDPEPVDVACVHIAPTRSRPNSPLRQSAERRAPQDTGSPSPDGLDMPNGDDPAKQFNVPVDEMEPLNPQGGVTENSGPSFRHPDARRDLGRSGKNEQSPDVDVKLGILEEEPTDSSLIPMLPEPKLMPNGSTAYHSEDGGYNGLGNGNGTRN
eukprot:TRINITY_DN8158_c0_g2_i1.p1 TRINITY_DN8158_c0_g2~~TRINITY_DN8158_c0_g2_i1.p1  ORF type:complete len:539 (+),score=82.79 TRINITY_DN8158_c0_g2_i1:78-1694(+)